MQLSEIMFKFDQILSEKKRIFCDDNYNLLPSQFARQAVQLVESYVDEIDMMNRTFQSKIDRYEIYYKEQLHILRCTGDYMLCRNEAQAIFRMMVRALSIKFMEIFNAEKDRKEDRTFTMTHKFVTMVENLVADIVKDTKNPMFRDLMQVKGHIWAVIRCVVRACEQLAMNHGYVLDAAYQLAQTKPGNTKVTTAMVEEVREELNDYMSNYLKISSALAQMLENMQELYNSINIPIDMPGVYGDIYHIALAIPIEHQYNNDAHGGYLKSKLFVYSQDTCGRGPLYLLENGMMGHALVSGMDTNAGAGVFNLQEYISPRFGQTLIISHINHGCFKQYDIKNRGILVHAGNSAKDTQGCLLPGLDHTENTGWVKESRKAFELLMKSMKGGGKLIHL